MFIKRLAITTLLIAVSNIANANSENISLVGIGSDSEEIVRVVPRRLMKKRTAKMLKMMSDAGSDGLEKVQADKKGKWELQSIEIGPGIGASVGIGPWEIGGVAGFKLLFERQ